MAVNSAIEWTDATWNPTVGCSIISPGCTNCYAMKMAARLEAMGQPIYQGHTQQSKVGAVWNGKVSRSNWGQVIKPLSWKKPRRIFVNSMSDLFHENLPDEAIDKVFAVMALCPQHQFQVLTKRAARMLQYLSNPLRHNSIELAAEEVKRGPEWIGGKHILPRLPLQNIWLGVSAERQQEADERIPLLLQTPAAVRFISAEPLLGPIDLRSDNIAFRASNAERGWPDWVIVGGESGVGARSMHLEWAESLIAQCRRADVPCFMKQLGSSPMLSGGPFPNIHSSKGGDPAEWPRYLRVREFPNQKKVAA